MLDNPFAIANIIILVAVAYFTYARGRAGLKTQILSIAITAAIALILTTSAPIIWKAITAREEYQAVVDAYNELLPTAKTALSYLSVSKRTIIGAAALSLSISAFGRLFVPGVRKENLPLVSLPFDKVLGFAIAFLEALLLLCICTYTLSIFVSVLPTEYADMVTGYVDKIKILSIFYNNNPFTGLDSLIEKIIA